MSDLRRANLIGAGDENLQKPNGKRPLSLENFSSKKLKLKEDSMTDTTQKRSNFSALTSNGMKNSLNTLSSKPGCAKKLVIKNFSGK